MAGNITHKWVEDTLRVHDLALSPNGQRLVVLLEKRIHVYDFTSYEKIYEWALDGNIKLTSVNISQDSQYMLISMNENKIKLMDIDTGEVVESYSGHVQKQYIIRSAFGGANENFVVSGSEGKFTSGLLRGVFANCATDSRIYIWRTNGMLVEALDGHTEGCVNAVAWHPKDPKQFASAGDDHKVRIWKPIPSNGTSSSSNGYSR
jgi:WD40 repeat protein